jgi:dsRNA-specific ribonuclease
MAQAVDYEKLYSLIGYRFRNEKLIKTALTHSSYASEHKLGYERNNERLEFIGDAYVDAVADGACAHGNRSDCHEQVQR